MHVFPNPVTYDVSYLNVKIVKILCCLKVMVSAIKCPLFCSLIATPSYEQTVIGEEILYSMNFLMEENLGKFGETLVVRQILPSSYVAKF